jgi:hypothetical protein
VASVPKLLIFIVLVLGKKRWNNGASSTRTITALLRTRNQSKELRNDLKKPNNAERAFEKSLVDEPADAYP